MLARVAVKVMLALFVPVPMLNVRPVTPLSVNVPLLTLRVTCSGLPAESLSLTLIALPLAEENTSVVFALVLCAAGTMFTGATLTWLTVMPTVLVAGCGAAGPGVPTAFGGTGGGAPPT